MTRNCFHPLSRCLRARYTLKTVSDGGRETQNGEERKKITKSYLIQWLNPLSGGLISPKDISVLLKGSPDLKEEGYAGEGAGLWEEAEGDPESQQSERERWKDERRSEKRAYSDNTSALRGNARECWLTDSSCLLDIRAKPTPPSYTLYSISHPVERSTTSSVNHRKGSARFEKSELLENVSIMCIIRFPFVIGRNQRISCLIRNVRFSGQYRRIRGHGTSQWKCHKSPGKVF